MYPITSYSWPNTTKTWRTQIYNENICSKLIITLRLKFYNDSMNIGKSSQLGMHGFGWLHILTRACYYDGGSCFDNDFAAQIKLAKLLLIHCFERRWDRKLARNYQLYQLMDIFVNKLCILVTKKVSPLGTNDSINASVNQQTNYIAIINMSSDSHRGNQEVSEESVHDWLLIQNQHHRYCGSYDHEAGNCAIWILTIHGKMSTFHFLCN